MRVLLILTTALALAVGCTTESSGKLPKVPGNGQRDLPGYGTADSDGSVGFLDASPDSSLDRDASDIDCCETKFAIAGEDNWATVMLKGSALPLSDGVELTYANGEWSATVCLRPDYNEVYYYEVSRYGELEDGGVSGDVDTNFVEFNPFSPTAYDGNLGTVNLVAYAETCEDFDPTPYGWSEAPHVPADCSELLTERPHAPSGVYAIDPDGDQLDAVATYCDMDTDGGGWTLVLGGDLSGDNGANGYFDGNGVGAPSPFAEFKLGVDAQALSDMAPTELWVQTYSGHSAMFEISSTAGFSADYTSCNEGGKSLGGTVYWHAGRAGCYGSSHLGVSVGTDTVEANTVDTLHYGHFHRSGVNTGVYVFGENPAGTKQYINENEWEEQFAFWVRD